MLTQAEALTRANAAFLRDFNALPMHLSGLRVPSQGLIADS
jgi:hypothetical protein